MTNDDKREFYTLIAMTAEAYGTTDLSKTRLAMMFEDLVEFSIADVAGALREHRKTCKWFPKISEIVDRIRPNNDQAALVAWAAMLPLLQNSRAARSPDPITEKVIQDLGGWARMGQQDDRQLVWVEKEFAKRYSMYAEHGVDVIPLLGPRKGLRMIGRDL